eukprot:1178284-Prorocentrum_minimum.AAC.1
MSACSNTRTVSRFDNHNARSKRYRNVGGSRECPDRWRAASRLRGPPAPLGRGLCAGTHPARGCAAPASPAQRHAGWPPPTPAGSAPGGREEGIYRSSLDA